MFTYVLKLGAKTTMQRRRKLWNDLRKEKSMMSGTMGRPAEGRVELAGPSENQPPWGRFPGQMGLCMLSLMADVIYLGALKRDVY